MKPLPAERVCASPDAELERKIAAAQKRFEYASPYSARLEAWHQMRYLISQRSPAQVARMERAKGLS